MCISPGFPAAAPSEFLLLICGPRMRLKYIKKPLPNWLSPALHGFREIMLSCE
jgi:hypothetical protein